MDVSITELTRRYGHVIDPNYERVRDGMCRECTDCCSDKVPFSPDEIDALNKTHPLHLEKVEVLSIEEMGHTAAYLTTGDGKCVFLNDGRCDIYETRPEICRAYGETPLAMCGMEGVDETPVKRNRQSRGRKAVAKSHNNMEKVFSLVMKDMRNGR